MNVGTGTVTSPVPFLGIFVPNFRFCVFAVYFYEITYTSQQPSSGSLFPLSDSRLYVSLTVDPQAAYDHENCGESRHGFTMEKSHNRNLMRLSEQSLKLKSVLKKASRHFI